MDDDWDLHAVVRSCSSSTTTTTTAVSSAVIAAVDRSSCGQNSSNLEQDCSFSESDWSQDLHDLLKPFLPKPLVSPQNKLPISPLSVLGGLQDPSSDPQGIKQFPQQKNQQLFSVVNGSKPGARSKKRKNHQKKVCHVAAESLSSDLWSWRKYGQKPIKGSPYPRGYYRCSTSKGCMARKQVERNRSDPGMFIVTYTGEHNHPMPTHRNSLAGSTRHKSAEGPTPDDSKKESPGAGQLSPALEKLESGPEDLADMEDYEDDEEFGASKVALDDDFFSGLEDFAGKYLSDDFPTSLGLHWLGSNGTTAAEGGGGGGC